MVTESNFHPDKVCSTLRLSTPRARAQGQYCTTMTQLGNGNVGNCKDTLNPPKAMIRRYTSRYEDPHSKTRHALQSLIRNAAEDPIMYYTSGPDMAQDRKLTFTGSEYYITFDINTKYLSLTVNCLRRPWTKSVYLNTCVRWRAH